MADRATYPSVNVRPCRQIGNEEWLGSAKEAHEETRACDHSILIPQGATESMQHLRRSVAHASRNSFRRNAFVQRIRGGACHERLFYSTGKENVSGSGGGSENGERSSGVEPDEQERAWIESFEKWDEAWYALAVEDKAAPQGPRKSVRADSASEEPQLMVQLPDPNKIEGGYGTGRRKTSIARVWIWPPSGSETEPAVLESKDVGRRRGKRPLEPGTVVINSLKPKDYFHDRLLIQHALEPLMVTKTQDVAKVYCTVKGGGKSGQAGAIRHALSRALVASSQGFRPYLKAEGMLTRDSRMVERKKPGQAKARKKYQWVKR